MLPAESFLGMLGEADRTALTSAGRVARHRAGELILHEGGAPTVVLVVVSGSVKLTKQALSGREVVLELRGPGDIIGEIGALDGEPRSANVVALEPVELLVVPTPAVHALLSERASVSRALLWTLARRLRESSARQLELGTVDVIGRVAARLAELARSHGRDTADGVLVEGAISQQELADWAGVSRDGVVRALTELRRLGWIETGRQRVLIREIDQVRKLGEG